VARILTFLGVVLAVLGGGHYYLWARLVRDPGLPEPWRRIITVLLVAATLALPLAMFASRVLPSGAVRVVSAVLFTWMGAAVLLLGVLLASDAARLVAWLGELIRPGPGAPPDPERRLFVARAVAGGATLAAAGASVFAVRQAVGEPTVRDVPVRLERLPPALSGLTVAQLSDLHVGPLIGEKSVRRLVDLTNALRPDVVAITGDLVDGSVERLREATQHLSRLRARYGVYFVTGNHEYYAGAREWLEEIERYGIRPLRNERVSIGDAGRGGASIDLAGIDDYSARPDLARALAGREPDRSLVLLAHQPRQPVVGEAVAAGVELQLSGHTHGGQIFPWSLLVRAAFPYLHGLYPHRQGPAQGQVYVSCGAGFWGPPLRLGAPAEIARVVLTS